MGRIYLGKQDFKRETLNNFQNVFKDLGNLCIVNQMEVVQCFPSFFSVDERKEVAKPVSLNEILNVLKGFSKDKSPRTDGWTMEFVSDFFDLVGPKLVNVVEEYRTKGKVMGALKATFIVLIPNGEIPKYFNDLDLFP